jgi:hypothetical protein
MLIATLLIGISVYLILYRKSQPSRNIVQEATLEGAAGEP